MKEATSCRIFGFCMMIPLLIMIYLAWWMTIGYDLKYPDNPEIYHHAIERPATALEKTIAGFFWFMSISAFLVGLCSVKCAKNLGKQDENI